MSKRKSRIFFESNHRCYGYRRIYATLKKRGLAAIRKGNSPSYEASRSAGSEQKEDKLQFLSGRNHASCPQSSKTGFPRNRPNEKWLTDITEFAIPAGKVYLSPIIDCFDGMPVCWSIGISPNAELTNGMLDKAISLLKVGEHPVVHTGSWVPTIAGQAGSVVWSSAFASIHVQERVLA